MASVEPIGGGRNSRVWRVSAADGRQYALKAYFRHPAERRDRQQAEFDGLRFLWSHGLRNIPEPLATDRQEGVALYGYVAGQKVAPESIAAGDMETAAAFLGQLRDLARRPGSDALPPAAEACFSGEELLDNLRRRLDRLGQAVRESADPAPREFLQRELLPSLEQIAAWSRRGLAFDRPLPQSERTLSPSDFGFHNALRQADGTWVFLDFEYFGWDDPTKMLSDFLLHPAMRLTAAMKRRFLDRMAPHLAGDPQWAHRLRRLYPLFGLKWCVILLNEFVPEHLLRRRFAGPLEGSREAVQREQLMKSRRMLQQVCDEYEHFPYFD